MKDDKKQRRLVSFAMCHPVYVTVIAERESDDQEWIIVGVRAAGCDASARSIGEHMNDDDGLAFDEAVEKSKEVP